MSEENILNLRNFVRETNNFDINAEIAVSIIGIPMGIPIRSVTHTTIKDSDKKYVLLHIAQEDIAACADYMRGVKARDVN